MNCLQAIGEAAKFLAYARNIPLRAKIERMNAVSISRKDVILDIIWSAQFESAIAMVQTTADKLWTPEEKKVWKPNRAMRRKQRKEGHNDDAERSSGQRREVS